MDLLTLLKNYQPLDSADAQQAKKITQFINETPNCFERTHLEGHITASSWLVDSSRKKILLTHHKKLGKWLQLGGHVDGELDVLAAALREAREESGIQDIQPLSVDIFDVDIHFIPEHGTDPSHYHYDIRFLLQAKDSNFTASAESHELAWVEVENLSHYSQEASLSRMARKWELLNKREDFLPRIG